MVATPEAILETYVRAFAKRGDIQSAITAADLAYCAGYIAGLEKTVASMGSGSGSMSSSEIQNLLAGLKTQGDSEMATLNQIQDDIANETTLIGGVSTLIGGLRQQIADALSGATLPPGVQAQIDKAFTDMESNKAALASVLTQNTPAQPPKVGGTDPASGSNGAGTTLPTGTTPAPGSSSASA